MKQKTGGASVHMEKPSRKPDFPQKVDDDHHDDVKLTPGRLASERSVAKRGTAMSCVQNGNEGNPADESNLREESERRFRTIDESEWTMGW